MYIYILYIISIYYIYLYICFLLGSGSCFFRTLHVASLQEGGRGSFVIVICNPFGAGVQTMHSPSPRNVFPEC